MAIQELSVTHYRSIRELSLRLKGTNILTGPNGCGESNLYNSLFLLSKAATGGFAQVIAQEGGMDSVLWTGPRKKATKSEPMRMKIKRGLSPLPGLMRFFVRYRWLTPTG